jgi:hypothetical protein
MTTLHGTRVYTVSKPYTSRGTTVGKKCDTLRTCVYDRGATSFLYSKKTKGILQDQGGKYKSPILHDSPMLVLRESSTSLTPDLIEKFHDT